MATGGGPALLLPGQYLDERILSKLTSYIYPKQLTTLAIHLGLTDVEVEQIKASKPEVRDQILKIFCEWKDRNVITMKDLVEEMVLWTQGRCIHRSVWDEFVAKQMEPSLMPDKSTFDDPPPDSLRLPPETDTLQPHQPAATTINVQHNYHFYRSSQPLSRSGAPMEEAFDSFRGQFAIQTAPSSEPPQPAPPTGGPTVLPAPFGGQPTAQPAYVGPSAAPEIIYSQNESTHQNEASLQQGQFATQTAPLSRSGASMNQMAITDGDTGDVPRDQEQAFDSFRQFAIQAAPSSGPSAAPEIIHNQNESTLQNEASLQQEQFATQTAPLSRSGASMSAMASVGSEEKVGDFIINVSNILGYGAFGVVTTGTDANRKLVAAKKIPLVDKRKSGKVSDDLDRLKYLDHHNIVKIFEVDRQEMALYIFMEYCTYGDLKDFFEKRSRTDKQKFEMMHQIAMGVEYLHNKDIIHRDIKPTNILVAQEKPDVVKLTDFDCSKFLDPHYNTSYMSSDVGTPAFKAPEFFKRVGVGDKKHIIYYRNIDIYAAGLTFLAMIQGNEDLAPRIETANDESERFYPIGQLIYERIKYKAYPLEILSLTYGIKEEPLSAEDERIQQLRELIREMTRVEPTDRISAAQVVQGIQKITKISAMASGGPEETVGDFTINISDISDILGSGAFGVVTTGTDANTIQSAMASGGSEEKVGDFTINNLDIIGSGAFGIVTTGIDANGKTVAAKKIQLLDERKAREVSDDMGRLKNLDHKNIVKIFEVDQQEMALYIFMEYCKYGHLMNFFEKRSLTYKQKFEIMHQIAMGVEYLHSKDIIHRDIKPRNIFVAQEKPVVVKLTDFDYSKFLNPDYETSCMSSNVGTPAFKAPEFFQRVRVGYKSRIIYHRNIDIYAAGLTFLAMIQGNEHLAPRIETANDESELFMPIGQLIAERIKYKTNTLEILSYGGIYGIIETPLSAEGERIQQLRELIREMTRAEQTDRISAAQVVQGIQKILEQIIEPREVLDCARGAMPDS